jgi:hypothetical protein
MTLDEAIKQCEEAAEDRDKLCKRCDAASGYSRSHNEAIRTQEAKEYEKCSQDFKQLAEWLKELKAYKEQEPCADAISRQAAIRWVKTECNPYGKPTIDFESGKKVIEHLKQMPSVTPKQKTGKWIPVSESLPELDDDGYSTYVLVSFSNFTLPCIGQLRKTDGENHWYEGDDEKALDSFGLHVNAWMPLPEPYKAESEGRNDT